MNINYDWGSPVKPSRKVRAWRWLRMWAYMFYDRRQTRQVPLHMSSHYHRDHFHDDGQPRLF